MRKRGFTLIELLVVISILALLMGLLLPAVIGAMNNMKLVQARDQISALSKGIGVYQQTFNCLPGGPTPWNASPPATGAQLLQQALMQPWYDGVMTRQPLHAVHPGELMAHSQATLNSANIPKNSSNASVSYNGNVNVFVDYMYENPRPVLYFRFYEASSGSQNTDMQFPYNFKDNAVYCMPSETLLEGATQNQGNGSWSFQDGLGNFIGPGGSTAGYVLISAGPDRQYFTSGSVCSVSKY